MGIALRHDRRLIPQEALNLIQVYSGLNHPGRERMAKIVEMKILDLRMVKRDDQSPPDVAPATRSSGHSAVSLCRGGEDLLQCRPQLIQRKCLLNKGRGALV